MGGGILALPLWAFPIKWDVLQRPELIRPGTRVLNQWLLGPALTGELELDPPIKALFVYNSNPLVVAPQQEKIVAGLPRDDLFTVVSEQFLTDTADYADIVLPATTQLEQFDIMFSWGHFYMSINNQAIEPLGESVPNVEQFRRISERMGLEDDWYPSPSRRWPKPGYDWTAPTLQGITFEDLKEKGWARLTLPDPDHYAPYAEGGFPTGSGRCEFKSTLPEAVGNMVVPVFREGYNEFQPGGTIDPLPHYIPPVEDVEGSPYPLYMLSPKAHAFLNSQYGNMAYQRRVQGEQAIIMNADDAEARNIEEGQPVRLFNENGELHGIARIGAGDTVARGVVVCPLGHWRKVEGGPTPTPSPAWPSPIWATPRRSPTPGWRWHRPTPGKRRSEAGNLDFMTANRRYRFEPGADRSAGSRRVDPEAGAAAAAPSPHTGHFHGGGCGRHGGHGLRAAGAAGARRRRDRRAAAAGQRRRRAARVGDDPLRRSAGPAAVRRAGQLRRGVRPA